MIDYTLFFEYLQTTALKDVAGQFAAQTKTALHNVAHGDFEPWCAAIDAMPRLAPSKTDFAAAAVTIGAADDFNSVEQAALREKLMQFHPWRKGPFDVFGIKIDTEWRSDLKWRRLKNHINLEDKLILDVGCGNGYYLFRMLGAGAAAAVGVDPFLLSVMQFHAVNRYAQTRRAAVLPLGADDVPAGCGCFDAVFSMGLLYHRRNPQEHVRQLLGFLKPAGQLVLETLVLDRPGEALLNPRGRYAKMRNVWSIPSPGLLQKWLTDSGFEKSQIINIAKTTLHEQRKTRWMTYESLDDFLDPNDDTQTVEGHPAPIRAILLAQKP